MSIGTPTSTPPQRFVPVFKTCQPREGTRDRQDGRTHRVEPEVVGRRDEDAVAWVDEHVKEVVEGRVDAVSR